MLNHLKFEAICLLCKLKPIAKLMRIPNSSRKRYDRAWREQKQLFPNNTILGLADAVDFIEDNAFNPGRP